jgi:predicted GNAT family acetyltransferase
MSLDVIHDLDAREFLARVDGHRAVLQYELSDGLMSITHTRVPEGARNRGIAAALTRAALDAARAALDAARAAGWKVKPLCTYAIEFMRTHADYADLVTTAGAPPAESERRHVDELLDEALEESFPASDVPAVRGYQ